MQRESAPADPKELIPLHIFTDSSEDQQELHRLIEKGLSKKALKDGKIRRRDLLRAGFVFHNRIGAGEKPILAGAVMIGGQQIDLTSRRFLTQEELNAVLKQQGENVPGTPQPGTPEMEAMRQDMLRFLIEGDKMVQNKSDGIREIGVSALKGLLDTGRITGEQLLQYVEERKACILLFTEFAKN